MTAGSWLDYSCRWPKTRNQELIGEQTESRVKPGEPKLYQTWKEVDLVLLKLLIPNTHVKLTMAEVIPGWLGNGRPISTVT